MVGVESGSVVVVVQLQHWCVLWQFQERKVTADAAVAVVALVLLGRVEKCCCGSSVAALVRTHRNEKNEDKNRVLTASSTHLLWLPPTVRNLPTTFPSFCQQRPVLRGKREGKGQ